MSKATPLVSILCPTYNHGKFIAQTLEGFVQQKTTFPIEIIVHDDASTDNTATIAREYEKMHPDLFANIYQAENQFSKSISAVSRIIFAAARGKYIALCEGDDYWIDPIKLQRQVDFLEKNDDYATCFTNIYELIEDKKLVPSPFYKSDKEETYTIEDLAKGNFISTASVVFRNGLIDVPSWIDDAPLGDYILHMLNAQFGKLKYFPERTTVYRIHGGGIWSRKGNKHQYENMVKVLDNLIKFLHNLPNVVIRLEFQRAQQKSKLAELFLDEGDKQEYLRLLKEAFMESPEFMNEWLIGAHKKFSDMKDSTEYKIGWALRNPWFIIKKYIQTGRNKLQS